VLSTVDRRPSSVDHTHRPALCTARWSTRRDAARLFALADTCSRQSTWTIYNPNPKLFTIQINSSPVRSLFVPHSNLMKIHLEFLGRRPLSIERERKRSWYTKALLVHNCLLSHLSVCRSVGLSVCRSGKCIL